MPPVHRLPPELLCAIFYLAATATLSSTAWRMGFWVDVPWWLGHICASWRATALSYSHLWTTISVHAKANLTALQEQLKRTKSASLLVRFAATRGYISQLPDDVLALILATSPRWVALQLSDMDALAFCSADIVWMNRLEGSLLSLERLEIFRTGFETFPPSLFSSAPLLRRVLLMEASKNDGSSSVELPWSQITHYRAANHLFAHLRVLRLAAQNLVECVLGTWRERPIIQKDDIQLPRLHCLRLVLENTELLQRIIAPSLHVLALWCETRDKEPIWNAALDKVMPFVRRSQCTLTKLALFDCRASSASVIDLLRELPTLEAVLLETGQQDRQALFYPLTLPRAENCLNPTSNSDILLPKLRWFVYGYHGSLAAPQVFTMVRSRAIAGQDCTPITFFRLYETSDWEVTFPASESVTINLGRLRQVGVDAAWIGSYHPLVIQEHWGDF
ncbi:hypothetical protein C8F01DRAFT_1254593 [Mycena amicta]|nr:hypothetical protein C8F01DRAFT_1254593 [Mycena amicta]